MGDRTWTGIEFSGKITREVAEGLLAQLKDQGCQCDGGPAGEITVEHLREAHNQFYDEECNYATMEGVEEYCKEHGIRYQKIWSSGGGFGEGMEIFTGHDTIQSGTIEGETAVTLSQIKKLGVGFLGFLESFEDWEKHNPPLEITEATEGVTS
jgi:hypothetical protein